MTETGALFATLFSPPAAAARGLNQAEVMNLVFVLLGAGTLYALHRRRPLPRLPLMYQAYGLVVCACVATIAEGYAWAGFFNLVEHLGLAFAGIWFVRSLAALRSGEMPVERDGVDGGRT
jgi:hypothetical protein